MVWVERDVARFSRLSGAFVLTCAVLVAGPGAGGLGAQAPVSKAPFDRLFRAYAAGDRDIVRRTLRTGGDVRALQAPMDDKRLRRWLGPWDRTKAAFLLELADAEAELSAHHMTAIATGRAYVMGRPTPLGQNATEDAFEAAWHRMALGLLQDGSYPLAQSAYLDTIERRYASVPSSDASRPDARLALERGIAEEQRCALTGNPPECLRSAAQRFAAAALVPETADEANIRAAWAHYQLKSYGLALQTIDRACPVGDPNLIYWMHLFRGRILDGLHRLDDAEREYRQALEARPFAQSAGVALAATLFKLNRPDEAVNAARAVRLESGDLVIDPWWTYLRGDARFVSEWRANLRARITP
jgi:tetratricopeptide (TPR) repeat protein